MCHPPRLHDLDIFVQVHRLVVDVVLQEVLVHTGQQGHLRQGEDVHELLHGVSRTLQAGREALAREPTPQQALHPPGDPGHHRAPSPQGKKNSNKKVKKVHPVSCPSWQG